MGLSCRIIFGLAVALVSLSARAAPLEAYGRLPSLEDVAISPDGGKLAYVTDFKGRRTVVIQSISPGKALAVLPAGKIKLRDLSWADNERLLITTSQTIDPREIEGPRREWFMTVSYDIADKSNTVLLGVGAEHAMNVVAGAPRARLIKGHTITFVEGIYFANEHGHAALYSVDLSSGATRRVEDGSRDVQDWVLDRNGQPLAEIDYVNAKQRWSLRVKRDGRWTEISGVDTPIDTPDVMGLGPDGSSIVVRVLEEGHIHVRQMGLADGKWSPSWAEEKGLDSTLDDPVTHQMIGGVRTSDKTETLFISSKDQAEWDKIARAFPGENVELVSWSDDRNRIVVRVSGVREGAAYMLVDLKAGHVDQIGDEYEGIEPGDVSEVRTVTYKAADGREIMAYLTLPRGREPKALPLVVLPHGGPASRDYPGFDWWAQALASRGYLVLQPQFRGSDGFTWDLLASGFGEWGRRMQTDLSDGVRDLTAKGMADPKRVCIVGASYGGYAALAGATLDPGVYRCAASIAGLSDLRQMLVRERDGVSERRNLTLRYWDRFMGAKTSTDPALDAISPAKLVDKVSIPILLVHGRDDTVVPIEQSRIMEAALKRAGKAVTFVELSGEDHWLSGSETRLEMLKQLVAFLEANNPPGPAH